MNVSYSPVRLADIPIAQLGHVLQRAASLRPSEQEVLSKAGEPKWLGTALPWSPPNSFDAAIARDLLQEGLLTLVPHHPGAYCLTHWGELVAGALLAVAIIDGTVGHDV